MIRLSDQQLATLHELALPVPPRLRRAYLQHVADALVGKADVGDADVYKACAARQRAVLGAPPD